MQLAVLAVFSLVSCITLIVEVQGKGSIDVVDHLKDRTEKIVSHRTNLIQKVRAGKSSTAAATPVTVALSPRPTSNDYQEEEEEEEAVSATTQRPTTKNNVEDDIEHLPPPLAQNAIKHSRPPTTTSSDARKPTEIPNKSFTGRAATLKKVPPTSSPRSELHRVIPAHDASANAEDVGEPEVPSPPILKRKRSLNLKREDEDVLASPTSTEIPAAVQRRIVKERRTNTPVTTTKGPTPPSNKNQQRATAPTSIAQQKSAKKMSQQSDAQMEHDAGEEMLMSLFMKDLKEKEAFSVAQKRRELVGAQCPPSGVCTLAFQERPTL